MTDLSAPGAQRPSRFRALTLRRAAQFAFAALCLHIGWRFAAFLRWTADAQASYVPRPAGVEAFLPVAALAGLKNLLATGQYDPVHPAGLSLLLAALACSLVFRKSFCGFVCPVGLASDLAARAGARLGIERRVSNRADAAAGAVKYLLLAFFLISVFAFMDPAATRQFLVSRYNLTADAAMLRLFTPPSARFAAVLGGLFVLGLVFRNAWCRWLCPYGALLGLAGRLGPTRVTRDAAACDGCGRCRKACPMDIAPGRAAASPQCLGCAQCLAACTRPAALTMRFAGRAVPAWLPLAGGVGLFAGACLLAMALGGWDASLPPAMLRALYAQPPG